jgi:PAS domain-containing protein
MFLDSCKSDTELAERNMRKSEELRIIEDERSDVFADGDNSNTHSDKNGGLLTASSDGLIESVNNLLLKMFGYNKSELIGIYHLSSHFQVVTLTFSSLALGRSSTTDSLAHTIRPGSVKLWDRHALSLDFTNRDTHLPLSLTYGKVTLKTGVESLSP